MRRSISALIRRFARDSEANIAVIFALALVPVIGLVGAAVDYSVASNQRTKIQEALDTALLAGSTAGRQALNSGASHEEAINAAQKAATSFFVGNMHGIDAVLDTKFKVTGLSLSGTGDATLTMPTTFTGLIGFPKLTMSVSAGSSSATQPYLNVYLLVDISSSMLLPSTQDGITQMIKGTGCALACHDQTNGKDSYSWALKKGIQLRYQVVNQGVQNLLTYLNGNPIFKSHVKVGLWSFDNSLTQMSSLTSNFNSVSNNFPAPGLASDDAAAATPFDKLISNFISTVGNGGDGSSNGNPQKLVIIATDGVNDPTRAWTSQTSLRPQVRVFDTSFCTTFKKAGVTVAIINTPYYPMTWDWGYNATLGQPGSLGGATRVDDIPIALSACAGENFLQASDPSAIQAAFTTLFTRASPVRITN